MDAYLEFLDENSYRRYPLAEDCPVTSSLGYTLSDDVLLDLRVVSRRELGTVSLSSWTPATRVLSFSGISGQSFSITVPDLTSATLPLEASYLIPDPQYPEFNDIQIRITFGPGALSLPQSSDPAVEHVFSNTLVEFSAIMDLSGSLVNLLGVIRQAPASDFLLQGDVVINGGHFVRSSQSDSVLTITTDPSGGQLGAQQEVVGSSPCSGVIFSISGVSPSSRGDFQLLGSKGVSTTTAPESNTVIITADVTTIPGATC